ncbi:transglycosylase SLT domain-containing protein [Candidatus Phycosocius spiralis]|uniref:Transglycosylase SLT domain-containing protein n=1 Tax=Candidatus Phycosocius spiralis TaxID=2815099 RepID=A0ABQ4PSS7_9PROT|nr:transglycosylase SLT domain-containing protein [Candidatus Phycosocius spiralis]GIU66042.1 hypothetical protein PsB1_0196 [Candidatus Phycosocius spiralis]
MTPQSIGGSPVRQAIAQASRDTGMDFQFLLATAVRESALNPKAEAKTSSATGLFQFLDSTWLATLKRHGAKHGLGAEASQIDISQDGRPSVNDRALKRALLDLRYDPKISALMAAEFAGDNADYLRARTGQEPEAGDLYAAHFLGAGGAAELVNAVRDRPWASAADLFPSAAAANRTVFYKSNGQERTVSEVLENLRATPSRQAPAVGRHELGYEAANLFGPNQPLPGGLDHELFIRLMTSILSNDMFDTQPNEYLSLLKQVNNQKAGETNPLSASMLAQLYAASDRHAEDAGLKSVQGIMGLRSMAQILSPDPSGHDEPGPSPLGFGLDTQA